MMIDTVIFDMDGVLIDTTKSYGLTGKKTVEYFLKKRKSFDPIKKRKALSNCTQCFGTNYIGGYFDPINSRAFFNISKKIIRNIGFEIEPDQQFIEMANYPIVSPGDIIKHESNYRVNNVRATRRSTYIISQFVQVERININDIEYELGAS